MFNRKALCKGMFAALLVSASTNLYAAATTYTYTITGDVIIGDETFQNAFGLTAGETITAYGTFTADSSFANTGGTVSFDGLTNTMTIALNMSTIDTSTPLLGTPYLSFAVDNNNQFVLTDFHFPGDGNFNSSFMQFDDMMVMYGEWRTDAQVTAVPEAETYAMMLAGLGLVGWMGARRKTCAA